MRAWPARLTGRSGTVSDHRGASVGFVVRRLWAAALTGVLVTVVCWAGVMLAVPRANGLPLVELTAGVVR